MQKYVQKYLGTPACLSIRGQGQGAVPSQLTYIKTSQSTTSPGPPERNACSTSRTQVFLLQAHHFSGMVANFLHQIMVATIAVFASYAVSFYLFAVESCQIDAFSVMKVILNPLSHLSGHCVVLELFSPATLVRALHNTHPVPCTGGAVDMIYLFLSIGLYIYIG